jgi:catechol 2,3-dioxygenase
MNYSKAPLSARLCYLQIGSPDPARLAHFYARLFDASIERRGWGWLCRRKHQCLAFAEDEPGTLRSAGYAVSDAQVLRGLSARTIGHTLEASEVEAELFGATAVVVRDPDDHRMAYGLPVADTLAQISRAPPARLQHLVLGSTDVDRMVEFYTKVIGLRESDEVLDDKGRLRASFMRTDQEHHSFAVFLTSSNRLDHHCHEVAEWNDMRDWGDRLAAHSIPIEWGPGRHGPGNNLFMFFHDPDGNWVELSAELEVVPASRPVGLWPHEERTLNRWGRGHLRS